MGKEVTLITFILTEIIGDRPRPNYVGPIARNSGMPADKRNNYPTQVFVHIELYMCRYKHFKFNYRGSRSGKDLNQLNYYQDK